MSELGSDLDPELQEALRKVVACLPGGSKSPELIEELLTQVVQLPAKNVDPGELKLLSSAMRDFTRAFEVFGAHRGRQKISVFGSARSKPDTAIYAHARSFSAEAVARGYMVITGAGPGIMQACNEGATREHSFGVSINLPFEASANPAIDGDSKLIDFKYFFTRKLAFVKESAAIVLFPGGVGTLDEGYEALTLLQTGKSDPVPVVLMDLPGGDYWPAWERYARENLLARGLISPSDRNLYCYTTDIGKAMDVIDRFYRHYHSIRYVADDYTILRLKRRPNDALLALLNERYRDLLASGDFERLDEAHPLEDGEPDAVLGLPRIGFKFVRRGLGRLRRMIDEINLADLGHAEKKSAPRGSGSWRLPASGLESPDD